MKKTLLICAAVFTLMACGEKKKIGVLEDEPKYERSEMEFEEDSSATDDSPISMGGSTGGTMSNEVTASEEDVKYNEEVSEEEEQLEALAKQAEQAEESESELEAAARGAYERGKEKLSEKKQEIEESETYQNAKEKANEIKEAAKEKTTDILNDMFQ
jgi:hypothetical protein